MECACDTSTNTYMYICMCISGSRHVDTMEEEK